MFFFKERLANRERTQDMNAQGVFCEYVVDML